MKKKIKINDDFHNRAKVLIKDGNEQRKESLSFEDIFEEGLLDLEDKVGN